MKSSKRRVLIRLQDLVATYWFLPTCMVAAATALSLLMPWVDKQIMPGADGRLDWILQTQPNGARAVLTLVAGSIIGVAATVFSITIVAVSFASGNFGPRLISNFMRDRGTQLTLGLFIATFVYCLLVLGRVRDGSADAASIAVGPFVPHLSVLLALALAVSSVALLIYFIHHVPETINIDRLMENLGRRLIESVSAPTDDIAGRGPRADTSASEQGGETKESNTASLQRSVVTTRIAGFVERVDLDRLDELAKEHDLRFHVEVRPGDFVLPTATLVTIRSPAPMLDACTTEVRETFHLSRQRTPGQDWLFLADQLVEVIGRALSPGINDPVTAMTSLDWLASALIASLASGSFEREAFAEPRVRLPPIDFERFLAAVFDAPRQYIASDRLATIHALGLIAEVAKRATREEDRRALRTRLDELQRDADAQLASPADRQAVLARYEELVRTLDVWWAPRHPHET